MLLLFLISDESERAFVMRQYDRLNRSLLGYAYKLSSDAQWAQDITQEVFLIIIDKIQQFLKMNDDEIAAYCFIVVKNAYYRYSRQTRHETDLESSEHIVNKNALGNPTQELAFQGITYERIKEAVRTLPERHQMIIALKFGLNYKHSEIAVEMNISESYSQNLLSAAITKLRQIMLDESEEEDRK